MPLTRPQCKEIWQHFVHEIMGQDPQDPLYLALAPFHHELPQVLITLNLPTLDSLTYLKPDETDPTNNPPTTTYLAEHHKQLVCIFGNWIAYCAYTGLQNDNTVDGWKSLTHADFNNFCVSGYHNFQPPTIMPPTATFTPSSGSTLGPCPPPDPVLEFKKGIKHDLTVYPTLNSDTQWDTYNRAICALACTQDVFEVLDPHYTPMSPTAKNLYDEKQKFMYAVFQCTLLTDQGKAFVCQHADDYDAAEVYAKISAYAMQSTKASLDSSKLLSYITSVHYGDGTWCGTAHGFLLHWAEQVCLYHELVPDDDQFSDTLQRIMLQNAVQDNPSLAHVKQIALQFKTCTGNDLTYPQYFDLVKDAAVQLDATHAPKRPLLAKHRTVYNHDLSPDEPNGEDYDAPDDIDFGSSGDHDNDDYDPSFDIDLSINQMEVYNAARRPPRRPPGCTPGRPPMRRPPTGMRPNNSAGRATQPYQRLHPAQWQKLDEPSKRIWDQLSDNMKAVILNRPPPFTMQSHMHEVEYEEPPDQQDYFEDAVSDPTSLTAHAAHQSAPSSQSVHPAHPARLMSSSTGRPPSRLSHNNQTQTNNPPETVTFGNTTYRKVSAHITYHASNHSVAASASLVDCGANGGIAGSDVCIIAKIPDCTVNICGIDNHEITEIPIVTAGGVVKTNNGEVIVVLHQYAYHGKGKTIHSSAQLEHFKNDVNDRSVKVPG